MAKQSKASDAANEPAAEWVETDSLKPWLGNPRKNDGEPTRRVAESIKRFGFAAPIIARTADREIIAGHTRWKAARSLGLKRVPVRFVDLDPADAHLLALADNRYTELTEWDKPALGAALSEFGLEDAAFAGWDSDGLSEIAGDLLGKDESTEVVEGEVPEPPKVAVTKPGDVWILGDHVLVCGDCRNASDVARLLDGERVNVAFTSPPYASQREYDESSGFRPIHPDDFVDWFEAVQANVRSVLAVDGSWFVNIKEHSEDGERSLYVKDLAIAHVRRWGWRLVDELAWLRQSLPGDPNRMRRFKNGWEPVFHFAAGEFKFRPDQVMHESAHAFDYATQKKAGKKISADSQGLGNNAQSPVGQTHGMAYPSNVLDIMEGARVVGHSAAFPAKLPAFFVKAYTDPGDAVFDPFMGSGTTIIACEQLGRRGFGAELSPNYCDLIVERWQNLTGGKAERRSAA